MAQGETSVAATVRAEMVGADFNAAAGLIDSILTPVVGIDTVTNEAGWISTEGTETETDEALRTRALLRWDELSRGANADAYRAWALAVSGVVAVDVDDQFPRGPGTVDVIITSAAGLPSQTLIGQVQTYIDARRPIGANVLVRAPAVWELALVLTLKVEPGTNLATIEGEAEDLLQSWFVLDTDSGRTPLAPGDDFIRSQATAALMALGGVVDVVWTQPAANVVVDTGVLIVATTITVTAEEWE
jgi:phage-related baseplate assembly protein